jgi:hypothetical protein
LAHSVYIKQLKQHVCNARGCQTCNLDQFAKVAVNFLKAHPDELHSQGSFLTVAALKAASPCPYKTPRK